MAAIISNTGLYPYNMYHIEVDDIDKQEQVKGELNIEIDILKQKFSNIDIANLNHKLSMKKVELNNKMTNSQALLSDLNFID